MFDRVCSGAEGHTCPMGLATMDESKCSRFLVAIMDKKDLYALSKEDLIKQ
jgi:hypothetical protein